MKKYIYIFGIIVFCVGIGLTLWTVVEYVDSNHVFAASPENNTESTTTIDVDTDEIDTGVIDTGETEFVDTEEKVEETIGYIAPEGWYQPVYESSTMDGGDYNLDIGVMGLKVYYVQKYFNLRFNMMGYYREPTRGPVYEYQTRNGLEPTGVVDLKTWLSLGFSEKDWYELGTYIAPVRIDKTSQRDSIINVFLDTAMSYLGTPYVVGASGKPGEGVDCSGLVLQCLYSIGVNPDGLDPVQHSTISEYTSRLMWADPKFKEVSRDELLPGDLIFYHRPWGNSVCHVAIYLGDDKCIEALHSVVEIADMDKENSWDRFVITGFKRVIAADGVN